MKFNKRKVRNKIAYSKNTASAKSISTHKQRKREKYIIYIIIYYKVEKKIQTDYTFISTSLFRGCPLVRRFNKNILYHRLYTI